MIAAPDPPAASVPKPTLRRRVLRMIWIALGLYLAAVVALTLLQRRLLYVPSRADSRVMLAVAKNDGFAPWENAGRRIGWKRSVPFARGRALILHGNAGMALNRIDYGRDLQQASGFDVFILEYPGYGDRPGAPGEGSFVAAAEEAFGLVAAGGPVHLVGESLGTGVAAHLAARHPDQVAGLLLFTPFDRLVSVARHHMPIFPVRWMLRDRFESVEHLERYHGPVGILLAGNDEVVPDKFGRRLYDGYRGPKKLWEAPGASHNDVYDRPPGWWQEVVRFWETHQSPPAMK